MLLTPNSQPNHLRRVPRAPLQEPLEHGNWITFTLQNTKSSCHATVNVVKSNAGNLSIMLHNYVDFSPAMVPIHIMCNLTLPKDSTGTKRYIKLYFL